MGRGTTKLIKQPNPTMKTLKRCASCWISSELYLTRIEDFKECLQNAFRIQVFQHHGLCIRYHPISPAIYDIIGNHAISRSYGHISDIWHWRRLTGWSTFETPRWNRQESRLEESEPKKFETQSYAVRLLKYLYISWKRPALLLESCTARHVMNWFVWSRSMYRSWWIPGSRIKAYWSCGMQTLTKCTCCFELILEWNMI